MGKHEEETEGVKEGVSKKIEASGERRGRLEVKQKNGWVEGGGKEGKKVE